MTKQERANRQTFVDTFVRETAASGKAWSERRDAALLLLRHSKTHGRMAELECSDERLYQWAEKRGAQLEARIAAIVSVFGITARFGGDPRGYTVKVMLPSGAYNTWGGREEGFGIPQ